MADGAPLDNPPPQDPERILLAALWKARVDEAGAAERARRWADENAQAIRPYNAFVEEHGVVGDDFRSW
jgi:post-segregation antitoxin (ccd killing protein)